MCDSKVSGAWVTAEMPPWAYRVDAFIQGAFCKYGDLYMPGQAQGKTESGCATANDKYIKTVVSCHDLPAGPSGNYYLSIMHGRVRLPVHSGASRQILTQPVAEKLIYCRMATACGVPVILL